MSTELTLDVSAVTVRYGGVEAVTDARMFARPGTITAIVGPNGAGKSSLFLAMMGALKTSGSKVSLLGTSLDALGPTAPALSLRPEKEMPRRQRGHLLSSLPHRKTSKASSRGGGGPTV